MLHPHTELRYLGPEIGSGVFATSRLPKGTITWVQDPLDQVIDLALSPQYAAYPPVLERYSFRNREGQYVLCWDYGRFVNHHCEPNCLSPGLDFEIAVRDIEAGEELTNDYGSLNLEFEMVCCCGSARCRRKVVPADFERMAGYWDELLASAFSHIAGVEQLLWSYLEDPELVRECLSGRAPVPSIRNHASRDRRSGPTQEGCQAVAVNHQA